MLKLETDWGSLAYSDSGGTGLPMIFLRGMACNSNDWSGVIAALPRGPRLITLDFRAHGESDIPVSQFGMSDLADDVLRLADQLGLAKLLIVGHSLGGMVAMALAMRSPRVAGLVLLEGWTSLAAAAQAFPGRHLLGGLSRSMAQRIQQGRDATYQRIPARILNMF
jgi:pimeloyl-ACP methyl ester carboxylesterase